MSNTALTGATYDIGSHNNALKPKELDMSNTEARIETANKSPSGADVGRSSDLAALHLSKAEA